ncbi:MAG: hypothetical protein IKV97_05605 [Clostridia bacterium]|nr:hypothetical protein [Clostridia bacterium]
MYNKNTAKGNFFDYSDKTSREETISHLMHLASRSKCAINSYWKKMRDYYDGDHEIRAHNAPFAAEQDIPWDAAQSTDGFIHAESQVDTKVPEFEFSPRTGEDYERSKQRERITRFVCDINSLERKNAVNERRLNILGSAVYKVCWDSSLFDGHNYGDVVIDIPKPEQLLTDPSASTVDGCEYIGYVYRMHRQKAKRIFEQDIKNAGFDISEFFSPYRSGGKGYYDYTGEERIADDYDDTVTVTEWWFRQPEDGSATVPCFVEGKRVNVSFKWKAGDIALSVLVGGREIRYIPKYWKNTVCTMFPFVIYTKIPKEDSVWGKSELEALIPLIDASDRELAFAQLNSAFSSNDIIVAEENALSDDGCLDNSPGAVWKLRPGMMGKIQRLGNAAYTESNQYNNSAFWREVMKETAGNYDLNQGVEPTRVTTASGIALLNERAKNRQMMKKVIKAEGFRRLYELIDRTALEYYDDGRILQIGAVDKGEKIYRFADFATYPDGGDCAYIPLVDVKIHVGDGIANSKAFTVQALSDLMKVNINEDNFRLVQSYVELMGLPMRGEICDALEKKYGGEQELSSSGIPAQPPVDLPSQLRVNIPLPPTGMAQGNGSFKPQR